MFISKVRLNPGCTGSSGALVSYLARNASDLGAAHHLLWSLFPDYRGEIVTREQQPQSRKFLFHMDGDSLRQNVVLYSVDKPNDCNGLWEIDTREMRTNFSVGETLMFKIRVNPTIRRKGKHHDIVMDARRNNGCTDDRDAIAQRLLPDWIRPRLDACGVKTVRIDVGHYAQHHFIYQNNPKAPVKLSTVDVGGMVEVVDQYRLADSLMVGIGSGKAYGCGMLLVR